MAIGITIKIRTRAVNKYIAITHHPVLYTARVYSSIQLQLGSYIHTCINETHSLAPLQDLIPTLAS